MCELDISDGDPCEFYRETHVRARPRKGDHHVCVECGERIERGELHRSASGKDADAGMWSVRVCSACDEWKHAFDAAHRRVEGYVCSLAFGDMWEAIEGFTFEYLGYDPNENGRVARPTDPKLMGWTFSAAGLRPLPVPR